VSSDAQHADDTEVADVAVHVSDIKPVRGRGNIAYECVALVEIGGLPIQINGVTLRNDRPRELATYLPHYRSGDGLWRPALSLPRVVEQAIARAALEQAGGVIVTTPIGERDDA